MPRCIIAAYTANGQNAPTELSSCPANWQKHMRPTLPALPEQEARTRTTRIACALGLFLASAVTPVSADPGGALRERYLDFTGLPSESAYLQLHGILPVPGSESFDWQVVFKLAYRTADLSRLNEASAIHTDCYVIRNRKYAAVLRVQPVWDGRVYQDHDRLMVAAYTTEGERVFGHIGERSRVVKTNTNGPMDMPPLKGAEYNPFSGQLWRPASGGDLAEQPRLHLPLPLINPRGDRIQPEFRIVQRKGGDFSLVAGIGDTDIGDTERTLATCALTKDKEVKRSAGYSPVVGPGCTLVTNEPTTVIEVLGNFARELLDTRSYQLVLQEEVPSTTPSKPAVRIDGTFDDWRSVPGIADPAGDIVSYLQYNPDTDLLEFKVANDDQYLYFYTRVAGRHGNTAANQPNQKADRDRYYFYIYMDVDRDSKTGYLPTRDDECYYGVTLGVDCEPQFEFIDGKFVKTFFGFAGRSTEKDVLSGRVELGPSWYHREDEQGRLRDGYKVEYTRSAGQTSITRDLADGATDDITVAFSPDGSECEMRAAMSGFLQDKSGKPTVAPAQRIDLAAGVETSGRIHGNSKWSADSTVPIRGYLIGE
jgi:hypothetical protein